MVTVHAGVIARSGLAGPRSAAEGRRGGAIDTRRGRGTSQGLRRQARDAQSVRKVCSTSMCHRDLRVAQTMQRHGLMPPSPPDTRSIRERLEARRRELLVRYENPLYHADTEVADDSGQLVDVANDQSNARVLTAMSQHDVLALENIVAALHRLDAGDYGRCIRCGDQINPARLRILPEVRHCTACAALNEKRRHARALEIWA
jgi:RNA polymerase-binding transcription factor DksA